MSALAAGNPDGEDEAQKATRLAARAARFNKSQPGKRNKELEDARAKERQAFEAQGLINSGKTQLGDAVDMKGTCERMCSPFEIETRNIRMEVHPFEKGPDDKLDPNKAVAAYTRSDAGAGHGSSAILPSDLRTPATLVRTLDYLFSEVMPLPPNTTSSRSIDRKALGHSAGFIRDRTRAIRKEFAMQSTWGHQEAIASFERIARWHILCLRELQEETGFNSDMHIDSAELGRCFTSLRHLYNDRREETGLEMPCPNEPEMRAYMLIFDLANKSVSIPTSELPAVILDDPLVKLAWEIRKSAQRNFDSQKEGSKLNAELGSNLITRFIRLLKKRDVPFLLGCMAEVRLREMRRSALRALTRTYPRLKTDPIRLNDQGDVVERKMLLLDNLNKILGCEEQDDEDTAWQDVVPSSRYPNDESVNIVTKFELEVWPDKQEAVGSLINLGAAFDDNQDAPFTRRWKLITDKRSRLSLVDIVNGQSGVLMQSGGAAQPVAKPKSALTASTPAFSFADSSAPSSGPPVARPPPKPLANGSAFNFSFGGSSSTPAPQPAKPAARPPAPPVLTPTPTPPPPASASQPSFFSKTVTFAPTPEPTPPTTFAPTPAPSFSFTSTPKVDPPTPAKPVDPSPATMPSFFNTKPAETTPPTITTPAPAPVVPMATLQSAPVQPQSSISKPSQPSPRRVSTLTESQRRAQRKVLPDLRDKLIAEVVADKLASMDAELRTAVKQHRAARAYAEAKARRQEAIAKYAQQTFDRLLEQVVDDFARDAHLAELWRRNKLRSIARHWRRWAARQREDRVAAKQEREEAFRRLGEMGLGSSSIVHRDGDSSLLNSSLHAHREGDRLDPFAADVLLHQTERSKNHFYSAGTFLATISRYVAPLLQPPTPASSTFTFTSADPQDPIPSTFRTLISPSRDSATPSSDKAFRWLQSKLLPDHDEPHIQDGITFDAEVMGRYDKLSSCESLGLLVFEAPLTTWSSEKQRANAADAQDRLKQLHDLASNQANEYTPALLLISWEDETLDEVVDRLGIRDNLKSFAQVALLSLESADDLDARFATVLEALLSQSALRHKVIVDLQDAANRLYPSWERFLATLRATLPHSGINASSVCACFKLGIEAINDMPETIKSALQDVEICETSTFDPPVLPEFVDSSTSISEVAEAIAGYLSDDLFADYSDVSLFIAPLRQAAFHGHVLPIDKVLQSLATMVLGDIAGEKLPLRAFFSTPAEVEQHLSAYTRRVGSEYTASVNDYISKLGAAVPRSPSASPPSVLKTPSPTKTLKRTHSKVSLSANDENRAPQSSVRRASETKALKNAKLLKALKDVEHTLGSLEREEQQRVDVGTA